jgi:hypothetical protein
MIGANPRSKHERHGFPTVVFKRVLAGLRMDGRISSAIQFWKTTASAFSERMISL